MTINETAPAKINLALHVRARRGDGYHDIETLFAFLRDGDSVTIAESERDSFALTGPFAPALAGEGGNLVLAARDAFAATYGPLPPLAITLPPAARPVLMNARLSIPLSPVDLSA